MSIYEFTFVKFINDQSISHMNYLWHVYRVDNVIKGKRAWFKWKSHSLFLIMSGLRSSISFCRRTSPKLISLAYVSVKFNLIVSPKNKQIKIKREMVEIYHQHWRFDYSCSQFHHHLHYSVLDLCS